MGLTSQSTGKGTLPENNFEKSSGEYLIALAGNPNVGKSTLFNALTGLRQHTGNWAGKTVTNALGRCSHKGSRYIIADLPGTYSLMANSVEEEAARDFLCFGDPDAVIVVCDGTCLERNLNLLFQTLEITSKTVLCVNLLDEAARKGISIDLKKLSALLGIPVVGVTAREQVGLDNLMDAVLSIILSPPKTAFYPVYGRAIEEQTEFLEKKLLKTDTKGLSARWLALRLLDGQEELMKKISTYLNFSPKEKFKEETDLAKATLKIPLKEESLNDHIISSIIIQGEETAGKVLNFKDSFSYERDRKIDRILTSKIYGIPIMLGMLGIIFWITIVGANIPSQLLSRGLFFAGDKLYDFLTYINCSQTLSDLLINGVYRVLAWVISVMLPPMAIFFPLFTILEDSGYLPRVAFNLDKGFKCANACGKQALTMCMGFGCNAAGVTGCRIIDSPRERLIAILTNSLVPCNGRFPSLITIISIFFAGSVSGIGSSFISAAILLGVILSGVFATLLASKILSLTVLKGVSSAFILELPPYRKPQIGKVIIRSIFDRTIFVLGRACIAAAPAGLIIWLFANISIGDVTILSFLSSILESPGRFLGMDGEILLGFILGFPANEIVLPIILMAYTSSGMLLPAENTETLKSIFELKGWTFTTALCTLIFILFHFPCSTTCLTIKKETKSLKWTFAAIIIPAAFGIILCAAVNGLGKLF